MLYTKLFARVTKQILCRLNVALKNRVRQKINRNSKIFIINKNVLDIKRIPKIDLIKHSFYKCRRGSKMSCSLL